MRYQVDDFDFGEPPAVDDTAGIGDLETAPVMCHFRMTSHPVGQTKKEYSPPSRTLHSPCTTQGSHLERTAQ